MKEMLKDGKERLGLQLGVLIAATFFGFWIAGGPFLLISGIALVTLAAKKGIPTSRKTFAWIAASLLLAFSVAFVILIIASLKYQLQEGQIPLAGIYLGRILGLW